MNVSFPVKIFNVVALLVLIAFMGLTSGKASATSPDQRMFGPWVVQQSSSAENIGLGVFFSPDGNFFLVDPKTKLGFNGTWVIGRAGLLVSVFGNGKWAKLWDADVSFESDDKMIMEVQDSQVTVPQRVVLQRVKF
jgi:hypothetical protein